MQELPAQLVDIVFAGQGPPLLEVAGPFGWRVAGVIPQVTVGVMHLMHDSTAARCGQCLCAAWVQLLLVSSGSGVGPVGLSVSSVSVTSVW